MSIQGPLKVSCGDIFPHGCGTVGAVTPFADFHASTRENRVQARDKESGLPVWTVDVMDFDPDARERTFKVKIAAAVLPVPPEAVSGAPVRPVVLEGLTVLPYVTEAGRDNKTNQPRHRVAFSIWATGLASPRRAAGDAGKAA